MSDSLNWRPERPCRPEVASCIRFIQDSLLAEGLTFTAEQDDAENPNCWAIVALDRTDHQNLLLVGWNPDCGGVVYAALKPDVVRRDELEGVPEEESKAWWCPQTAEQAVMALNGEVWKIMLSYRVEQIRRLDEESQAA